MPVHTAYYWCHWYWIRAYQQLIEIVNRKLIYFDRLRGVNPNHISPHGMKFLCQSKSSWTQHPTNDDGVIQLRALAQLFPWRMSQQTRSSEVQMRCHYQVSPKWQTFPQDEPRLLWPQPEFYLCSSDFLLWLRMTCYSLNGRYLTSNIWHGSSLVFLARCQTPASIPYEYPWDTLILCGSSR